MKTDELALGPADPETGTRLPVAAGGATGHAGGFPGLDGQARFAASADDDRLEFRRAASALLRRARQILLTAALVVIPVAVSTLLAERLYRASAMVQIDPEPVQVLPYREIDTPSQAANYEMFMRSEEQILQGAVLSSRVAERLKLESGADAGALKSEVPRLRDRMWLARLENTQIFRIGYVAPQPEVAAKVANVYAEEYLKLHFDARQQTRERAKQQLEAELHTLEESVRNSDQELVAYAQAHGIPVAENAGSLIEEKLATLSKQLTETETEAFAASSRLDALKHASVQDFPEKLMTPVISGLVTQLASLEHERTALRATFGPNWPAVVQKDKEISLVREQLAREKSSALEQARQQALLDVRTVENKRRLISASVAEQQQFSHALETASTQYKFIRNETEKNRKLYEGVLDQLKKTSLTSGMEFGGFRVVEQALPPTSIDSPKYLWNLSLALVLGLALGTTIALARSYWDTSITTVEEVEQLNVLPVLGTLPLVESSAQSRTLLGRVQQKLSGGAGQNGRLLPRHVEGGSSPASRQQMDLEAHPSAAEDMRSICASLLLSRSGRPPRILLVTSAAPEEGKTTLATALAHTLADTGASTLLVDCDVRKGRLDRIFDVTMDGGLTLYLAGHCGPMPTIHATAKESLFVVAAGPTAPNPPALLGSDRMKAFLGEMGSSFKFVVLDAPPVMPIADARVLARLAEGVILVVRAGQVPKSMIRRACLSLEAAGGTILGAVLNGPNERDLATGYRYYRDYHRT